jgi:hypothetical protein
MTCAFSSGYKSKSLSCAVSGIRFYFWQCWTFEWCWQGVVTHNKRDLEETGLVGDGSSSGSCPVVNFTTSCVGLILTKSVTSNQISLCSFSYISLVVTPVTIQWSISIYIASSPSSSKFCPFSPLGFPIFILFWTQVFQNLSILWSLCK